MDTQGFSHDGFRFGLGLGFDGSRITAVLTWNSPQRDVNHSSILGRRSKNLDVSSTRKEQKAGNLGTAAIPTNI